MAVAEPVFANEMQHGRASSVGYPEDSRVNASAVSWGAVFAGAAAAAALSLILLILGTGLGLSSLSPWAHDGVSAKTFGISTIVWVTVTSLLASGMGGYLAGRLRTKWLQVHADEVYFRDTAHGFLAWAIASLAAATLLSSVIGSIVSGGVQAGASLAGSVAGTASSALSAGASSTGSTMVKSDGGDNSQTGGPTAYMAYFVDSLFRKDGNAAASTVATTDLTSAASNAEVSRIFMNTLRTGALPADDLQYLGRLVAQRTGLGQPEAEQRVTQIYSAMQTRLRDAETAAKDAADKARKATAYAALWLFVSLLMGAFVASLAATHGGRQRDS